jgi:hypothetical protein
VNFNYFEFFFVSSQEINYNFVPNKHLFIVTKTVEKFQRKSIFQSSLFFLTFYTGLRVQHQIESCQQPD